MIVSLLTTRQREREREREREKERERERKDKEKESVRCIGLPLASEAGIFEMCSQTCRARQDCTTIAALVTADQSGCDTAFDSSDVFLVVGLVRSQSNLDWEGLSAHGPVQEKFVHRQRATRLHAHQLVVGGLVRLLVRLEAGRVQSTTRQPTHGHPRRETFP